MSEDKKVDNKSVETAKQDVAILEQEIKDLKASLAVFKEKYALKEEVSKIKNHTNDTINANNTQLKSEVFDLFKKTSGSISFESKNQPVTIDDLFNRG